MKKMFFPPEWYSQSAIQLTWPHPKSDWSYMLEEITECFIKISREILKRQKLIIICDNTQQVKLSLGDSYPCENLILAEISSNDTWTRDYAPISVFTEDKPTLLDFSFNGWGLKFPANFDNQINKFLFMMQRFNKNVHLLNKKGFILEGGSVESDGKGTLLTTTECLLSPNRNPGLTKSEIEDYLKKVFGLDRILWLDYGYLKGDDTDSHIDTLARFCNEKTITYVKCEDVNDEHYESLRKMEEQLMSFVDYEGEKYNLIPLPMVSPIYYEDERLPATYANFLIMNDTVLVPTYGTQEDVPALNILRNAFYNREVVGINCLPVIKQHGSLHCLTMQYPEGFF